VKYKSKKADGTGPPSPAQLVQFVHKNMPAFQKSTFVLNEAIETANDYESEIMDKARRADKVKHDAA